MHLHPLNERFAKGDGAGADSAEGAVLNAEGRLYLAAVAAMLEYHLGCNYIE